MDEIIFSNSEIVARIILTILSIPIFNLFNEESNSINMRLIKQTIENR